MNELFLLEKLCDTVIYYEERLQEQAKLNAQMLAIANTPSSVGDKLAGSLVHAILQRTAPQAAKRLEAAGIFTTPPLVPRVKVDVKVGE